MTYLNLDELGLGGIVPGTPTYLIDVLGWQGVEKASPSMYNPTIPGMGYNANGLVARASVVLPRTYIPGRQLLLGFYLSCDSANPLHTATFTLNTSYMVAGEVLVIPAPHTNTDTLAVIPPGVADTVMYNCTLDVSDALGQVGGEALDREDQLVLGLGTSAFFAGGQTWWVHANTTRLYMVP